jgi:hypothetical protein
MTGSASVIPTSLTERGTIVLVTRPWTLPEVTGIGRLPMHSVDHHERLPLDGRWRFQLLRSPEDVPGTDWSDADVPGLWTMADTWDSPHYTNVQMPFPGLPPEIPALNPTGVYERDFEVPGDWLGSGRRVVLHVGAAESVLIVELDGERARARGVRGGVAAGNQAACRSARGPRGACSAQENDHSPSLREILVRKREPSSRLDVAARSLAIGIAPAIAVVAVDLAVEVVVNAVVALPLDA